MAGGKLSARQKMINLMYLVFIAMLALQMSKKVLSAFGKSSEEMQAAANMKQQSNDYLLQTLETQATDQPKQFKEKYEKAKRIEAKTKEFESYLKKLKDTILNKEFKGNVPDTLDYEAMSNSGTIDEMFFKEGKLLKPAIELKQTIEDYKNFLLSVTDADDIKKNINLRFETKDEKVKGHGVEPWAKANFEGFPTISSVFKLDNYVNKAKETENEIISTMLRGQLISSNKLTNYTTVVKLQKPAYFPGEFVQGRVYLGRTDESMTFNEVVLNGQKLDKEASAKGYVELNFRTAPGLGEKKAKGIMKFIEDGEEKPLDFEVSYTVMPKPKSAVISADKMNVVYRGVKNPMSISFPGVSDNKVKASAPGLVKKGSGSYVLDVTSFKGKEITIKVSGIVDGKSIPASKTFRVKNIPTPLGTVRGESGLVKMPKRNLEMSTIGAAVPEFDFDVKLGVKAFDFKVPGQPTVTVRGTRLNAQAKSALRRVKRGQTVQIYNIKAYLKGNSGYRIKKPAPIVIEIVN